MRKKTKPRQILIGVGVSALVAGAASFGISKFFAGKTTQLDITNGVSLLPEDTLLSIAISTDAERWQKLREFGVPESRGVFEQKLTKLQTDFLTSYGYDYQRDIQPWVGKQILFAYLYDRGSKVAKAVAENVPKQQMIALLPIANEGAAKQALERTKIPIDANLVQSNYKGIAIREIKGKKGTIASAVVSNFVAISTDRQGLERIINTQQGGKSLVTLPGYNNALKEIEIDRPFVQIYLNVPAATALTAANSPQKLAIDKIAQSQSQQGIAANAALEADGIGWKGISWLKPNAKPKLIIENQGQNLANNLPDNTLIMLSGGNLQRLWQDYVNSAQDNPLAPFQPDDAIKNLEGLTGLNLKSEILNWSKGAFGIAMVPKVDKSDTEFGAGLVLMQQVSDRSAADVAFGKLDNRMIEKQAFKVEKAKLGGKNIVNWVSSLSGTAATHGWLDNNLAFMTLGAPVANSFLPQPPKKLADNLAFQEATRSNLNPHNGQFFIDIDRTINQGNLPIPYLTPEVAAFFKGSRSLGITSSILNESSNRFDLFIALKKVAGAAKLPPAPPKPKVLKPSPSISPGAVPKPSPSTSPGTVPKPLPSF
jgi:Protein of unknown function (DUF3352)